MISKGIRVAIGGLAISAAAFVGLTSEEYFTSTAIIPTQGDRPTVGFGSTFRDDGTPVQMGDKITPTRALQRSLAHIQKSETALKKCVTADLLQGEWDLLVNHSYQYGEAATCSSPMVREANAGNYEASCRGYLEYRFMTSATPYPKWEPYRWDAKGKPTRWRFDCSTPGNKICRGVATRSEHRYNTCMGLQ